MRRGEGADCSVAVEHVHDRRLVVTEGLITNADPRPKPGKRLGTGDLVIASFGTYSLPHARHLQMAD